MSNDYIARTSFKDLKLELYESLLVEFDDFVKVANPRQKAYLNAVSRNNNMDAKEAFRFLKFKRNKSFLAMTTNWRLKL